MDLTERMKRARDAVDRLRDHARERGMHFRERDRYVMDIHAAIDLAEAPPPEVVSSAERIITEGTYDADARTVAEWVGRRIGKIATPPPVAWPSREAVEAANGVLEYASTVLDKHCTTLLANAVVTAREILRLAPPADANAGETTK